MIEYVNSITGAICVVEASVTLPAEWVETANALETQEATDEALFVQEIQVTEQNNSPLKVGSSLNNQVVNGAGSLIQWDVELMTSGYSHVDTLDNTQIIIDEDGYYHLGGFITVTDAGQRFEGRAEILINGVGQGERGSVYIRNAGSSYDFGSVEMSTEPFELNQGDSIQVRAVSRSGATYGGGSGLSGLVRGVNSRFWVSK